MMNSLSVSDTMICYSTDPATGKLKLSKMDRSKFMQLLAEAEERDRNTPLGTGTLTAQEIEGLAQTYDPHHMSQKEYQSFIDYLVSKNVLGRTETYDIGLDRVVVRPGAQALRFVPNLSSRDLSIRTLKDANGDALYWADLMLQWCNRSFESDRIRAGALQKVSRILQQMDSIQKRA